MKLSTFFLLICIIVGIAFLSSLGFWQLNRLAWKEGLMAQVEANMKKSPLTVDAMKSALEAGENIRYRPITVSGEFIHEREAHYFATHAGRPGYFIYTPLRQASGEITVVNRGFVPVQLKSASKRSNGQLAGVQSINGLAREAPSQKPNSLVPNNDLVKNIFYWKSLNQMVSIGGDKMDASITPFFVDAGFAEGPQGMPRGGTTRVQFPNNHLQYALTWFGLAGTLLFVGGFFLFSRRQIAD